MSQHIVAGMPLDGFIGCLGEDSWLTHERSLGWVSHL
jgi:hypothetical protein